MARAKAAHDGSGCHAVAQPGRTGYPLVMRYADWKNDFTFYRLFGDHEDVLRDLLNDLMELKDEQTIATLEYLPRDQAPQLPGGRRAIVDVKCQEVSGRVFIVEMQLFSHPGFVDRVVYNACRALVSQLSAGDAWRPLADVVAVAICNFEIWPNRPRADDGEPLVPWLSRWQMTEADSGARGLGQIRYLFLELPKQGDSKPKTSAETWAWLFRKAATLELAPQQIREPELTTGQRKALTLAHMANFTAQDLERYERIRQEIWVTLGITEQAKADGRAEGEAKGRTEGLAEGRAEGEAKGKREALLLLLQGRGIPLTEAQRNRIASSIDVAQLEQWFKRALTISEDEDLEI